MFKHRLNTHNTFFCPSTVLVLFCIHTVPKSECEFCQSDYTLVAKEFVLEHKKSFLQFGPTDGIAEQLLFLGTALLEHLPKRQLCRGKEDSFLSG